MTKAPPRYRALADRLRETITSGALRPGDLLPTELEICASEGISRHTAREALRILSEDGLIERRPGAGTVVAAAPRRAFAQSIGDFEAILQYARDAHFYLDSSGDAAPERLEALGLSGAYWQLQGRRIAESEPPIALTTVFVLSELAPDDEALSGLEGSMSEWIENTHTIAVARVTQRMEAVALTPAQAQALSAEPGSPALRTLRRYRDGSERIILLSESLHPAGRFAYEMRIDRTRG
jgi:DNA-binding GntR family transcriptional regulator